MQFCRTNSRFYEQVGGGVVIFEVQRSSRSEARKEEARKQELEVHFFGSFFFLPH